MYSCLFKYLTISSGVALEDKTVVPATDQAITCLVSGLSENTPITWIGPDNLDISESDTDNYVVSQGSYVSGSKAATLTIKSAKLNTLTSGSVFKCKLKSSLYPTNSPEVIKEMNLNFFSLSMLILHVYTSLLCSYLHRLLKNLRTFGAVRSYNSKNASNSEAWD